MVFIKNCLLVVAFIATSLTAVEGTSAGSSLGCLDKINTYLQQHADALTTEEHTRFEALQMPGRTHIASTKDRQVLCKMARLARLTDDEKKCLAQTYGFNTYADLSARGR